MKKFLIMINIFFIFICFTFFGQNKLFAQRVGITIEKGVAAISIAAPKPIFNTKKETAIKTGNYIFGVFKDDLRFSLVFSLIPEGFISYIRPLNPKQIFFKDWESIGAKILVVTEVSEDTDDNIIYSITVYDVKTSKMIFGKKYRGKINSGRLIAHRAADEMMINFGEKPVFSSKIVFVSSRDGNKEIYMMDYDGNNQTRLTKNRYIDILPAISPDKQKIAYTSYRSGKPDLYIQYLYEGVLKKISTGGVNYGAQWSYDGKYLVYTSSKSGNAEIYIADSNGSNPQKVTFSRWVDSSPDLSPSNNEIALTSDRTGSPQIYVINRDGTNIRRITFEGTYNDSPAWSPDGENLLFVSRIEGRFDIYKYNFRAQTYSKLTDRGRNENPSWSPDGRHIVFSSTINGAPQIYITDYKGTRRIRLTYKGKNTMPFWSK
jgi:TolB protein